MQEKRKRNLRFLFSFLVEFTVHFTIESLKIFFGFFFVVRKPNKPAQICVTLSEISSVLPGFQKLFPM